MNSLFKLSRKRILFVYSTSLLIMFVTTAIATVVINSYYEDKIVESENQEFLDLYQHMSDNAGEAAALIFVNHYSFTHKVGIIIQDDHSNLIYHSDIDGIYYRSYMVEIADMQYKVLIDNSTSGGTIIREREEFIIRTVLFGSFAVLLVYITLSRRIRNKKTVSDIKKIQHLLNSDEMMEFTFNYFEFYTIHKEVSEKITMIDLLQEKYKENLNGFVHDLKTPLTILMDHVKSADGDDSLYKNKEAILQSLDDLNEIASDIIAEKFTGDQRVINLSKYLTREVVKYEPSFHSKDIILKYSILENANVIWNKRDIARVIRNLMTNAFYYSDEQTTVYVNLLNGNDSYVLQIINCGQVIEQSLLSKIFEKNTRSENNLNKDSSGIGLYVTKLLVEEVGATITASSNDKENIFTITIPKAIEA